MGITTDTSLRNKLQYAEYIQKTAFPASTDAGASIRHFMHPEVEVNVTAPFDRIDGSATYVDSLLAPIQQAFRHLSRRTDIILGGEYEGNEWVVSHGHYVGEFVNDWIGIPATGDVTWLHTIEYHRMVDGRAIQTYLYFDMLDLLRQVGRLPTDIGLGFEGFVPGPANGAGVQLTEGDATESARSLQLVEDMLQELWKPEENWRKYWHPDMLWYGPSGYGSQIGLDGFECFQQPYEAMFAPGSFSGQMRKSGNTLLDGRVRGHFARFGDGDFVASGGWPSHGGVMCTDWLGTAATNDLFTVRVADIWRRSGNQLLENWVFVDIVDMALQLGRDLFADAGIDIRLQ